MKVPLSWLKEYVDIDVSPAELAARLTFSGTEVEGIRTLGGDYTGIVVGEVRAVEKHPNADRLTVCRVETGAGEITVVCGAPNVAVGMKAPLAVAGVTLPNGTRIKKAKVRGVESAGMLCAEDELCLSDDHSGLMVLPASARAGMPFAEIAGPPDVILSLEITPNRPDCLSMIGIAREIAVLLGKPLRIPDTALQEESRRVESLTSVTVGDSAGCPRYTARVLSDVRIGPSPDWMQRRLTLAGVRPINNVVDITNYVMLECGQPLHAFDYALLSGNRIVVRRATAGESMSTLDGTARAIDADMLMIADDTRPVAVAGVMGGAGSEIRDTTRTVLLESAYFAPTDIRRTSKRLGLSTESSYRFERGVDVGAVEWASRRAAQLMAQHAQATVARGVIDVEAARPGAVRVALRPDRVRQLLGVHIADADVKTILGRLGFVVDAGNAAAWQVEAPSFRVDIDQEADLIEEVARIHGLDRLPSPSPSARIVPDADDRPTRAAQFCRTSLAGLGLAEIMNYSFLSEKLLSFVGYGNAAARIAIPNPISADHSMLRDSLIPQMLETLGRNRSRQAREAALFEMGRVFFKDSAGRYAEEDRVCVGLFGPVGRGGVRKQAPVEADEMFAWIKGILESFLQAQHVPVVARGGLSRCDVEFNPIAAPCFEEGCAVSVRVGGAECGVMGLVSRRIRNEWRMSEPAAIFELAVGSWISGALRVPAAAPIGQYPGVERDVAMAVDDGVSHGAVMESVWKAAPAELVDVRLFDVYRSESLGRGRKSMAYAMTYRAMDRTLTDSEANALHERIKEALRRDVAADIRES